MELVSNWATFVDEAGEAGKSQVPQDIINHGKGFVLCCRDKGDPGEQMGGAI